MRIAYKHTNKLKKLAQRHVRCLVVEGGFCQARIIKLRRAFVVDSTKQNLNGSVWTCMDLLCKSMGDFEAGMVAY